MVHLSGFLNFTVCKYFNFIKIHLVTAKLFIEDIILDINLIQSIFYGHYYYLFHSMLVAKDELVS